MHSIEQTEGKKWWQGAKEGQTQCFNLEMPGITVLHVMDLRAEIKCSKISIGVPNLISKNYVVCC